MGFSVPSLRFYRNENAQIWFCQTKSNSVKRNGINILSILFFSSHSSPVGSFTVQQCALFTGTVFIIFFFFFHLIRFFLVRSVALQINYVYICASCLLFVSTSTHYEYYSQFFVFHFYSVHISEIALPRYCDLFSWFCHFLSDSNGY